MKVPLMRHVWMSKIRHAWMSRIRSSTKIGKLERKPISNSAIVRKLMIRLFFALVLAGLVSLAAQSSTIMTWLKPITLTRPLSGMKATSKLVLDTGGAGRGNLTTCSTASRGPLTVVSPPREFAEPSGHKLPEWSPTVPNVVLKRGVAYRGDMIGMDAFLHKIVVERQPVTVLAIGTSIAAWSAGSKGPRFDGSRDSRNRPLDGWITKAMDYLVAEFPPSTLHTWENVSGASVSSPYWLLNEANGGTGPDSWLQCLGRMRLALLPKKMDLIIIDYAVHGNMDDLDDLIQLFLHKWQPPPAFLAVNFFHWCYHVLRCKAPKPGKLPVTESDPDVTLDWSTLKTFSDHQLPPKLPGVFQVKVDAIALLGRYYGFPVLSVREAFFQLANHKVPNYGLHDLVKENDVGTHPSVEQAKGKFGDLLISFFRSAVKGMVQRRAVQQRLREETISVSDLLGHRYFAENHTSKAPVQMKACFSADPEQGPPIPIHTAVGFKLTNDTDTKKRKPGIITWSAGSTLLVNLSTIAEGEGLNFSSRASAKAAQAIIQFTYLISYERMGDAHVTCSRACSCVPQVLNGTNKEHVSVPTFTNIPVTQAESCHILLTVHPGSHGGQKFKVLSLSVMFQ